MVNKIQPAYSNSIPIIFSSNMKFVPIMAAMIESIVENSSKNSNYDIIILTVDIHGTYVDDLKSMVKEYPNFSLRIVDVSSMIEGYSFYTENRADITAETYFRLLLPDLLPNYSKVLYLDGDMIANVDIAELYKTDLEGYFLASSRDADGIGRYHKPGDSRKDYRDNVLKLKNPDNYFCAGMLVLNLDLFRLELPTQKMLDFAVSYQWEWHDQDVLNVLCEGKVKLLDMAWDVLRDAGNNQYMPNGFYEDFLRSEIHPKIVHYGGARKPWKYFDVERGAYFWKYATRTPFYKQILAMVDDTNTSRGTKNVRKEISKAIYAGDNIKEQTLKQFANGQIGFKYIARYFKAWLKYKFRL